MEQVGFICVLIGSVFGIIIWYFFNRASVRVNRQVEILESITRQLAILTGKESNDSINENARKGSKSAKGLLEEARKNAGL